MDKMYICLKDIRVILTYGMSKYSPAQSVINSLALSIDKMSSREE